MLQHPGDDDSDHLTLYDIGCIYVLSAHRHDSERGVNRFRKVRFPHRKGWVPSVFCLLPSAAGDSDTLKFHDIFDNFDI